MAEGEGIQLSFGDEEPPEDEAAGAFTGGGA